MPYKLRRHYHLVLLYLLIQSFGLNAKELSPPKFANSSESTVDAGHIKLIWETADENLQKNEITFELQQATDSTFTNRETIYKGPDFASFISGLKNGNYYYRIRALNKSNSEMSTWSEPVLVIVQHQSLEMAFTLFGIGAVVFLLTVTVVIVGSISNEGVKTEEI